MKNLLIAIMFIMSVTAVRLFAQDTETTMKEKMKPFRAWVGHWKGEAQMQMGPGEPRKSLVDENIEYRLGEGIIAVEGVGKATNSTTKEEKVVHHAFGVLSYNVNSNAYNFKTYLKDGKQGDCWFNIVGDNKYQWGFDTSNGKIRYSITVDSVKNTWLEIGEFSPDGSNWSKFFEMNLAKI